MDLFQTIDKIYTSRDIGFLKEIDESISPVVLNLLLSRYYKNSHIVKHLNRYVYVLDTRQYVLLSWSMIQPKLTSVPFIGKIEKIEEKTRYDFILDRIRKRLEIGDNDWRHCRGLFLEDVKKNLIDYLVFYGFPKKDWNIVGEDFDKRWRICRMKCTEPKCNNDFYGFDRISPTKCVGLCRKHYRMYALSWSEYEARRGKKEQ